MDTGLRKGRTGVQLGAAEIVNNGPHGRLRGKTRHAIDGAVNDVGTGVGGGQLRGNSRASRVMGVDVNGHVGELSTESSDLQHEADVVRGTNSAACPQQASNAWQV